MTRARAIAIGILCLVGLFGWWMVRAPRTGDPSAALHGDTSTPQIDPISATSKQGTTAARSPETLSPRPLTDPAAKSVMPPAQTAEIPRIVNPNVVVADLGTGKAPTPGAMIPGTTPTISAAPDAPPGISSEDATLDVDKITLSLRDFRTVMKENPVGTNAEITNALNGGNPKQARLLPDGSKVNAAGELVDRWGTPYFFHQLSKDQMEIRSAGPDRKMETNDDTVGR